MISMAMLIAQTSSLQPKPTLGIANTIAVELGFRPDANSWNGGTPTHWSMGCRPGPNGEPGLRVNCDLRSEYGSFAARAPSSEHSSEGLQYPRTISGWPLGETAYAYGTPDFEASQATCKFSPYQWAAAERARIDVEIFGAWPCKSEVEAQGLSKSLEQRSEAVLRRFLAEALAEDLDDNGKSLGRRKITGMDRDHTGYMPLDAWAKGKHLTVSYDPNKWLASFRVKGQTIQIALASDKAKYNGAEFDLGQFVMCKRGKWMVPTRKLDAELHL